MVKVPSFVFESGWPTCEKMPPSMSRQAGIQSFFGGVVGAVDRDVAVPGLDVVEQRLLLRAGEHVLGVAAIGVDNLQVILVQDGVSRIAASSSIVTS
jgi:hypothetical protein